MTEKQQTKTPTWTRIELAMFITVLVMVAFGVARCDQTSKKAHAKRTADEARYIETHDCAVAQMRGRYVASYRCTKPELRHMSANELATAAAGEADKL